MSYSLGGFLFIKDAIKFDYCVVETIKSLLQVCDQVTVLDAGSQDGTRQLINDIDDEKLLIQYIQSEQWDALIGKGKLAFFQNFAAQMLNTDYQLLVQGDEILHPDSYAAVRQAIQTGAEGFLCERVNLWGTPNHMLVVPENRQPCSTSVVRLTKRGYQSYDDGESIGAPAIADFRNRIKIVHYGFVRKREVMKAKIINMQEGVFAMAGHDPKLDQCEIFDPTLWFDGPDLAPINFTHPPIMKEWVEQRL